LPFFYRCFGYYGKLQHCLWKGGAIIIGQRAFNAVMRLSDLMGSPDHAMLDTGKGKVCLNLRDPLMLSVPNRLLEECPEVEALKSCLVAGDTFVDVGANHGTFSIIACKQVGTTGSVIAVEPQPRMAELLEKSLRANAACRFAVHAFACGERNGEAEFYIPTWSSGCAGLFAGFSAIGAHCKLRVPLKKFDDFFDWKSFPGNVVLKLDVEGSELPFLRGAAAMLRAHKPRILLEINPHSAHAAGRPVEMTVRFLRDLGYNCFAEPLLPLRPQALATLDLTRQRNVFILP
jgi:FkbM family methyltransferase